MDPEVSYFLSPPRNYLYAGECGCLLDVRNFVEVFKRQACLYESPTCAYAVESHTGLQMLHNFLVIPSTVTWNLFFFTPPMLSEYRG